MLWAFRTVLGLKDMISDGSFCRLAVVSAHYAQPLLLQSCDALPSHAPCAHAAVPIPVQGGLSAPCARPSTAPPMQKDHAIHPV